MVKNITICCDGTGKQFGEQNSKKKTKFFIPQATRRNIEDHSLIHRSVIDKMRDDDYRLPLLVYTRKGWEIEMDTRTDEFIADFDRMIDSGQRPHLMTHLKDRNREMIMLLLKKIEATGDKRYIPLLEDWAKIDYKKVRHRINSVIRNIENRPD